MDDKPAIPMLAPPPPVASKSVQRRLRGQVGLDSTLPEPAPDDSAPGGLPCGTATVPPPVQPELATKIYRVIETVDIPMGASRATLQAGEELSSRQHDIPRLVALGARLQEIC